MELEADDNRVVCDRCRRPCFEDELKEDSDGLLVCEDCQADDEEIVSNY